MISVLNLVNQFKPNIENLSNNLNLDYIINTIRPRPIENALDLVWSKYDSDNKGWLSYKNSHKIIQDILTNLGKKDC